MNYKIKINHKDIKNRHIRFSEILLKKLLKIGLKKYAEIPTSALTTKLRLAKKELIDMGIVETSKTNYSTFLHRSKSYRFSNYGLSLIRIYSSEKPDKTINLKTYDENDELYHYIWNCFQHTSLDSTKTEFTIKERNVLDFSNNQYWISHKGLDKRLFSSYTMLNSSYRDNVRLYGETTALVDICYAQVYLLATLSKDKELLELATGEGDLYSVIGAELGIDDRDRAKTAILGAMFDKDEVFYRKEFWIYFDKKFPTAAEFVHSVKKDDHRKLTRILQAEEARAMNSVWRTLAKWGVPFLSIHDGLAVKSYDEYMAVQAIRGNFKRPPKIAVTNY